MFVDGGSRSRGLVSLAAPVIAFRGLFPSDDHNPRSLAHSFPRCEGSREVPSGGDRVTAPINRSNSSYNHSGNESSYNSRAMCATMAVAKPSFRSPYYRTTFLLFLVSFSVQCVSPPSFLVLTLQPSLNHMFAGEQDSGSQSHRACTEHKLDKMIHNL